MTEMFIEEVLGESKSDETEQEIPRLVELSEPLVVSCVLPLSINYLKISPPGPLVPFEQLASLGRIGKIMVTGNVYDTEDPKYFRILLDKFDKIMEITCFTDSAIDVISLTRLYGKHEQLLNDLRWRYDNNMITDFYQYFKQRWTNVIFHDRFGNFLQNIFPLHEHIKDPVDKKLYLKLSSDLNNLTDEKLRNLKKCKMMSILHKNGLDRRLCDSLMGFLEFNKDLLPMYLTPSDLKQHSKDNYYMNQLLEPPDFASHHLKKYVNVPEKQKELSNSTKMSLSSVISPYNDETVLVIGNDSEKSNEEPILELSDSLSNSHFQVNISRSEAVSNLAINTHMSKLPSKSPRTFAP